MNTAIKLLVLLFGVLFLVTGLRWLLAPSGIAPEFGLALSSGIGLSSQIGDLSAFFLTLGVCILMGLTTRRSVWYYCRSLLCRGSGRLKTHRAVSWEIEGYRHIFTCRRQK